MAGKGGRIPGAGRKFGSKDRIPRPPRGASRPGTLKEKLAWEVRRNKWASAEIGRLVAENKQLRGPPERSLKRSPDVEYAAESEEGMAGKGGLRLGAGRKFGARDRIPRPPRGIDYPGTLEAKLEWEKRRNAWAVAEIGRLIAANERLREQMNYGTPFLGDSKALFEATMAGTYFPSQQQLYSARELLARQYPVRLEEAQKESEYGIFERPEYLNAIAAVTKALLPYPEARRAVAEALHNLEKARAVPLVIEARPVEA